MAELQACRDAFRSLNRAMVPGAHRGLLLDKFLQKTRQEQGEDRRNLLKETCGRGFDRALEDAYTIALDRWTGYWKRAPLSVCVKSALAVPMAIGLGSKGVIEAGVRLHHMYGLPVVPGSAIKGALGAWVDERYAGPEKPIRLAYAETQQVPPWFAGRRADRSRDLAALPAGSSYAFLFGDSNTEGALICEDAWWVPGTTGPPLRLDVVTPHHRDYYTRKGMGVAPCDTDEPKPVNYLTVAGSFFFVVHLRWPEDAIEPDSRTPYRSWLTVAEHFLHEMLSEAGLGAKKSQGYGRFAETRAPKPAAQAPSAGPGPAARAFIESIRAVRARDIAGAIQSWKERHDKLPEAERSPVRAAIGDQLREWRNKNPRQYQEQARSKPWVAEWTHSDDV
jgi:CRISPR-associated protein Cmr6